MAPWGIKISTTGGKQSPKQFTAELDSMARKTDAVMEAIVGALAKYLHETLLRTLDTGRSEWLPLSYVTKMLKGSPVKRIDSGAFKEMLKVRQEGMTAWVGIMDKYDKEGRDLELIARVQEGGANIRVTEAMRAWFAAQGFPLKRTTQSIVIPPRPLFGLVADESTEHLEEVVERELDRLTKKSA